MKIIRNKWKWIDHECPNSKAIKNLQLVPVVAADVMAQGQFQLTDFQLPCLSGICYGFRELNITSYCILKFQENCFQKLMSLFLVCSRVGWACVHLIQRCLSFRSFQLWDWLSKIHCIYMIKLPTIINLAGNLLHH